MSESTVVTADVLIIGGGLAWGWAAIAAARAGAAVTVVDKGYFRTSGVTAAAGPGHWWVPPDPAEAHPRATADRLARGQGLAQARWMERIIDLTWRTLPTLAPYYGFPTDARGVTQYRGLRGPEYLRALRRLAIDLGVRILDHHPALELLVDRDGVVTGAAGRPSSGRRRLDRPGRRGRAGDGGLRLQVPSRRLSHQHRRWPADGGRGRGRPLRHGVLLHA